MKITFLKSAFDIPLQKQYGHKNGDQAYPQVAKFTSSTVDIAPDKQGMQAFEKALQDHADKGYAMLKGVANKEITKERRKGLADRNTPTQHLVIDIDGLELPGEDPMKTTNNQLAVSRVAEQVIRLLPHEFHNVSYIVGVSSGYGRKPTINLHFHFLLDREESPEAIGDWLTSLNFSIDEVEQQLQLTATKKFLKMVVDPVTARNSQLIYIAPPKFHGAEKDPVKPDARIFLVEKQEATVSVSKFLANADPEVNAGKIEEKIRKLCKSLGVKYKAPSYTRYKDTQVVTNPGRLRIEYAYDDENFVRFNVNGGDSNAYWIAKDNPRVMYSFKGDPPFDFQVAAPEMFEWTIKKFGQGSAKAKAMVIHDVEKDIYAKVVLDDQDNVKEFYRSSKDSLSDWLTTYGELMPDVIEPWKIVFDPSPDVPPLDRTKRVINTYRESKFLRNAVPPKDLDEPLEYGYAYQLADVAPLCYEIISHMLGGKPTTFEHFMNWLAFCVKEKKKAKTAWLLHGRTGTGKGLFFNRILHPLIGGNNTNDFALLKRMGDIDDEFNEYMETCLFLMVDEFRMGNSKKLAAIENKLKNAVTEPIGTIRGMRQNPVQRVLRTNFIFATNDMDAMVLAPDDRRYNIAERQMTRLVDACPAITAPDADARIEKELYKLAGFLKAFDYDINLVRTPLENAAKAQMRSASAPVTQLFLMYLNQGDLTSLVDILYEKPTSAMETLLHERVCVMITEWVANANHRKSYISKGDLKQLLEYGLNRELPRNMFSKLMDSSGLNEVRRRINGTQKRVFEVKFKMDPTTRLETLAARSPMEIARLDKNKALTIRDKTYLKKVSE